MRETIKDAVRDLASGQEEERKVNARHREKSRGDRLRMQRELAEFVSIREDVKEGVRETVSVNMEIPMQALMARAEQMEARVRSVE